MLQILIQKAKSPVPWPSFLFHHGVSQTVLSRGLTRSDEATWHRIGVRELCQHNDIPISAHIHPMGFRACGHLKQDYSGIFLYLKDAVEFGFVDAADMPEAVRRHLPVKTKPVKRPTPVWKDNDGWLNA